MVRNRRLVDPAPMDIEELKEKLAASGSGPGHPYPSALRRAVLEYAESAHAQGRTWDASAKELGIHPGTLTKWRSRSQPKGQAQLLPVVVAEPEPAAATGAVLEFGDARVAGLALPELVSLLKALR